MTRKNEWMKLMSELAEIDRDEFRRIRARAWAAVANKHGAMTEEEIAAWVENAS